MRALVLAAMLAACGDDRDPIDGQSVVLVHGAWMGAWAWNDVKTELSTRGATVTAVELPGHGADTTDIAQINLRSYIDTVEAAIDAAPKPVVLVGHSMGGIVVTEAADERAQDLSALIYVTAFVPKAGQSLIGLSMQDADSQLGAALVVQQDQGTAAVMSDKLLDVFCADCNATAAQDLDAHYRDEPLLPFTEPALLDNGGYASVAKYYLYADEDHAISPANQHAMTTGIEWTDTAQIETSHSPFLSEPSMVVDQLERFIE
ncbi:MAG: alpha/beta fold hydrolase [Kofleriaceae bacterium]